MNKYFVIIMLMFGLTSCTGKKDEQYYRSHPKELQNAMKACPNIQPDGLNCQQIEKIGNRMNNLAYQLQYNPQGFGGKILALQETIAKQQIEMKKSGVNPDIEASLKQNKQDLADYLAVVKWLESPES